MKKQIVLKAIIQITIAAATVVLINITYIHAESCPSGWFGEKCEEGIGLKETYWYRRIGFFIPYIAPRELINERCGGVGWFECSLMIRNIEYLAGPYGVSGWATKNCVWQYVGTDSSRIFVPVNRHSRILVSTSTQIVQMKVISGNGQIAHIGVTGLGPKSY